MNNSVEFHPDVVIQAFCVSPAALSALAMDGAYECAGSADREFSDLLETHHKVYNFEVASTHTYIADGIRVHNRSVLSFWDPGETIINVDYDENGVPIHYDAVVDNGFGVVSVDVVARTLNTDGKVTSTTTTKEYEYTKDGIRIQLRQTDIHHIDADTGKTKIASSVIEHADLDGSYIGEVAGEALTPFLANALVGENVALMGKIAVDTVLDTVLGNLGEVLGGLAHHSMLEPVTDVNAIRRLTEIAFEDFGAELATNTVENAVSVVNQLIMAEIFEVVNFDGLPGAVFEAVTSAGLNSLLADGAQYLINTPFFKDVFVSIGLSDKTIDAIQKYSPSQFELKASNMTGLVATAVVNELLPDLETLEGQIASVVSAAGFNMWAQINNVLNGYSGPIGAVVGFVVGKLFDSLFDKDPQAWTKVGFDEETGNFVILDTWSDDGGNTGLSKALARAYVNGMNAFVDTVMAESHNYGDLAQWSFGHYEDAVKNAGRDGLTFVEFEDAYINAYVSDLADVKLGDGKMSAVRLLEEINIEKLKSDQKEFGKYKLLIDAIIDLQIGDGSKIKIPEHPGFHLGPETWFLGGELPHDDSASYFQNYLHLQPLDANFNPFSGFSYTPESNLSFQQNFRNFVKNLFVHVFDQLSQFQSKFNEYSEIWEVDYDATTLATYQLLSKFVNLPTLNNGETYADQIVTHIYNQEAEIIGLDTNVRNVIESVNTILLNDNAWSLFGIDSGYIYSDEEIFNLVHSSLQVAEDYSDYLENYEAINALIAANPDSALSAGWIATLVAAEEMGLNDPFSVIGDSIDNAFYSADGDDTIDAAGGDDFVKSYGGHDIVYGGEGNDTIDGGSGDDELYGDAGDDLIFGGSGADEISGGAGNDSIDGGADDDVFIADAGSDSYVGSDGYDILTYEYAASGLTINMQNPQASSGIALGDTIESVEELRATDLADSITASGATKIVALGGDDTIHGDATDNVIEGGDGDDTLIGYGGDDVLFGGAGDDSFMGGDGINQLDGGKGSDFYIVYAGDIVTDTGSLGEDVAQINVATGLSVFVGNWSGVERVNGYTGNDMIDATGSTDALILSGDAGDDTLIGGVEGDTFYGGNGNDFIYGMAGADILVGGNGDDSIFGGAGNDQMMGNAGSDIFVFSNDWGRDVISAFEGGIDLISFADHDTISSIDDLDIVQSGAHTVISDAGGGSDLLTLANYTATGLTAADFEFV